MDKQLNNKKMPTKKPAGEEEFSFGYDQGTSDYLKRTGSLPTGQTGALPPSTYFPGDPTRVQQSAVSGILGNVPIFASTSRTNAWFWDEADTFFLTAKKVRKSLTSEDDNSFGSLLFV